MTHAPEDPVYARQYPESVRVEAVRLYVHGTAPELVARRIGCQAGTVIRWARQRGFSYRMRGPVLTPAQRLALFEAFELGAPAGRLAEQYGVRATTVMRIVARVRRERG